MGFVNNMGSFSEIMSIYTTATVGDGLISQMPALLISVATGMIVTRSASESNINSEVSKQFLSQPKVLVMSGATIGLLILIPGFPKLQILVVSVLLVGLGILLSKKEKALMESETDLASMKEVTSDAEFYKDIDNVYGLLSVEQIEMEFGYSLISLVEEESGGSFIDRVVMFRKQFALEMGVVIPPVRLKDSGQLNPNQYSIKFKGEEIARGDVLVDHFLALSPGEIAEHVEGIETIEPAFGMPAKWVSEDNKVKAELAGYTLIDPTSVIITHLSEIIRAHAHELLSRQELNNILNNLKKTNEAIINDTIPSVIGLRELQKVLSNLLREGVPIRDMETILETLGDYGAVVKDIDMLTEYGRQSLKRTISHKFAEAGQLKVISLDAQVENIIMNSVKKIDSGSYLALEPQTIQNIVSATNEEVNKIKDLVQFPIVLTSPVVRIYFKKLLDQFYPNIVVLSFNEIDSNIQIRALGNISISSLAS